MIDALLSSPTSRVLEQAVSFTEQRHQVLVEDIANASTPGFVQKDMSVAEFQGTLREAVLRARNAYNDDYEPQSNDAAEFDCIGRVRGIAREKPNSVAFHDRGVRNMEYLMSEMADNALAHNVAAQFLKTRYDLISRAISMKA